MNKVALITGAGKGLGRTIAEEYAKHGIDVILNYAHSKNGAEELAETLSKKYKVKALPIKADVSNETEVKAMVDKSVAEFGKIDILVNNAGVFYSKDYFDKTAEDFIDTIKVNVIGAFLTSKYIAPVMIKNKYGKIVNISSNNAFQGFDPVTADYDVSKAGLNILTRCMAVEFAPFVNVNAVAPGWINTESVTSAYPGEWIHQESKKILKQAFSESKDIAKLIYFLSSDDANMITGEIYRIDGGYIRM